MRELERDQRADWFSHDHAQRDGHRELEVAVEREQDHEDQAHSRGADKIHLRLGLEKLGVLATPIQRVALG